MGNTSVNFHHPSSLRRPSQIGTTSRARANPVCHNLCCHGDGQPSHAPFASELAPSIDNEKDITPLKVRGNPPPQKEKRPAHNKKGMNRLRVAGRRSAQAMKSSRTRRDVLI